MGFVENSLVMITTGRFEGWIGAFADSEGENALVYPIAPVNDAKHVVVRKSAIRPLTDAEQEEIRKKDREKMVQALTEIRSWTILAKKLGTNYDDKHVLSQIAKIVSEVLKDE